jgi:xanthine dehydrogenase accessory factor
MVTLDLILGSAPREAGCRMIVTADEATGSIGGGALEFEAITHARQMLLAENGVWQEYRPYGLGPALKQCCGGAVTLLFERFEAGHPSWLRKLLDDTGDHRALVLATGIDRPRPLKTVITPTGEVSGQIPEEVLARGRTMLLDPGEARIEKLENAGEKWWLEMIHLQRRSLYLFGAGHVGQAVARLLTDMPFEVTWVDNRSGVFPDSLSPNIEAILADDAPAVALTAPTGSIIVVMTHSHELDEDICFAVLSRDDIAWLGLIGSATKRRRFTQRLAKRGISDKRLDRLVCPIGLSGIKGKQPATIALSLVAQLMHSAKAETEVKNE